MIKYKRTKQGPKKYVCTETYRHYSARYKKAITVEEGFPSDGATFALDVLSAEEFFPHDKACERGTWDDDSPITAWQAAYLLKDSFQARAKILARRFKYWQAAWLWARSHYWFWSTYFLGCKKARGNGWF